jgi:hypothetical protein
MYCRQALCALSFLAVLVAGGCGGGGGGSSSPSVTVNHSTVTVSATVTDAELSPATVTLTVSNPPSGGLYVAGGTSHDGVASVSEGAYTATTADFQIYFKAPYTLAPGTHNDSVVLEVCLDSACAQQIAGSPVTVKVAYTVNPPAAGAAPTMSVDKNAIAVQALPSGATPAAGIAVHIANAPSFALTAKVTSTSDAVMSTYIDPPEWNAPPQVGFGVDINLKPPAQLSPGVHTDQIKVELCLDPACVNPLVGSPQTVTVTYQVGNDVPGSFTINQVSLQAADMVADDLHSRLYVAVPASAPQNASSVAIVDPANATVTSYATVGFEPGKLAISDDGSYLYVGERNGPHIARLALPGMTLDATIVLANDPHGQVTWPIDIKVQPGSQKTIAVARDFKDDTAVQGDGIVIYDDTTARPTVGGLDPSLGNPVVDLGYLAWGSTSDSLYASGRGALAVFSISASGAQLTTTATNPGNVGRIQYVGGLLYADSGSIFDPGSLATAAALPNPYQYDGGVTADASVPRVYQILSNGGGLGTYLNQYVAGTLAPHGTADIQGVYLQYLVGTAFTRWGTSGLAFLATNQQAVLNAPVNQLVLVSGPFVTQ